MDELVMGTRALICERLLLLAIGSRKQTRLVGGWAEATRPARVRNQGAKVSGPAKGWVIERAANR